jgi:SAM-dependent methyltransferase
MTSSTTAFVGSIPAIYDQHLGPALFEPYALEVAQRLPRGATDVLEIAAGTGRVTRQLLARLPHDARLLATDLNEPMIQHAASVISDQRLTWRVADAQQLPLPDGSYDALVCQFGLMFVPDKPLALREMRRVLRPGGTLLLTTWDALERNPWTEQLHELAVAALPSDPPLFMLTPFSMPDPIALRDLVASAGFGFPGVRVDTVAVTGEASSAEHLAIGFVRGNPLAGQLSERGIDAEAMVTRVHAALAERFGERPCRAQLSAHIVTAIA